MEIEFIERGNGYPMAGDIVVDHEDEKAYRVLPDVFGTGSIETHRAGMGNSTALNVELVDYEEHCDSADVWEV